MIVVGHADGVDIVNASSADESDGEVSTTDTGAAIGCLLIVVIKFMFKLKIGCINLIQI